MNSVQESLAPQLGRTEALDAYYIRIRQATTALCDTLEPEDFVVQSMPDVSPTKWHLAHTTWFFENFILKPRLDRFEPFHERYHYLFNSYYYSVGQMHRRPERGLLSRPTVREIMDYRRHVDERMQELLAGAISEELDFLVRLGLNHEQQHQELMLTDIKHVFAQNPLFPALKRKAAASTGATVPELGFIAQPGGIQEIGARGDSFCFDNETPRHRVLIRDFALASRPVTNGEYLEFIRDGGYETTTLWLSDGWGTVCEQGWQRPLYWQPSLEEEFTLGGLQPLDPNAPVCHVSYYEADAFARWAGARLATEAEWELAAADSAIAGNFVESGELHPVSASARSPLQQIYGDVWEWTQSPYSCYPGFTPLAGSLGEYNGKFMCNQLVLRGGSCATPIDHIRPSYRNFFYPDSRWQFSGIRLAKDL